MITIYKQTNNDRFAVVSQAAQLVRWSPDGNKYVVAVNDKLDVYNLESASITGTITCRKRISSIKFVTVCSSCSGV